MTCRGTESLAIEDMYLPRGITRGTAYEMHVTWRARS